MSFGERPSREVPVLDQRQVLRLSVVTGDRASRVLCVEQGGQRVYLGARDVARVAGALMELVDASPVGAPNSGPLGSVTGDMGVPGTSLRPEGLNAAKPPFSAPGVDTPEPAGEQTHEPTPTPDTEPTPDDPGEDGPKTGQNAPETAEPTPPGELVPDRDSKPADGETDGNDEPDDRFPIIDGYTTTKVVLDGKPVPVYIDTDGQEWWHSPTLVRIKAISYSKTKYQLPDRWKKVEWQVAQNHNHTRSQAIMVHVSGLHYLNTIDGIHGTATGDALLHHLGYVHTDLAGYAPNSPPM